MIIIIFNSSRNITIGTSLVDDLKISISTDNSNPGINVPVSGSGVQQEPVKKEKSEEDGRANHM